MHSSVSLLYSEIVDVDEIAIILSFASISSISPSAQIDLIGFDMANEIILTSAPFTVANHGRGAI